MRRLAWILTVGLAALAAFTNCGRSAAAERPNVVLIVADNLGYGDLSCYGCRDIATPNIDKLATQGVRFTNFYANGPECSPTRTALFTGRYQQRVGGLECALGSGNVGRYDDAIWLAGQRQLGLPPAESTLIHSLKQAGYRTVGLGKWHLGYEKHFLPPLHGFDYFLASLGGTIDYFYHNEPDGTPVLYENDKPIRRDGYFTDMITDGATSFLRKHPKDKPFFLYLPYTAPSAPFQHPDRKPDRPKVSTAWDSGDWQAGTRDVLRLIIQRLDQGVGRVLKTLEETGHADNALVIFCSDNGAYPIAASNAPFRGYASELFEGGIHVACMARWPGVLPEDVVDDRPVMTFDLSASILAAAGIAPPGNRPLDGTDVLGQIAAGKPPVPRTLYWRARRAERTWKAVRDGNLKYVSRDDAGKFEEWLFDLSRDVGEQSSLMDALPDDAKRLKQLLAAWEQEVQPARKRPGSGGDESALAPLFSSIDLDIGQSRDVPLPDGTKATIKLLGIKERRDPVRDALRGAEVRVEVNGVGGVLPCATYNLPTAIGGVQVDCPVIKGYLRSYSNYWSIDHDARFRIWPENSPLIRPGTFQYPVAQRWGAAGTLFDNEIGDGELYGAERVYYHQGFDFGGADRLVPIVAATDGVVVSARGASAEDLPECIRPRYDVVYLRDPRGWYYRYSHFDSIDESVQVGGNVTMGRQLGILGKEGASGGWSHLHFELIRRQENGRYGSGSMYAFLHQVYQAKNDAPVIAVARPQILDFASRPILLDGSRSWSAAGRQGLQYEWTFDDGTKATGVRVEHVYAKPGRYRPTLRVTDAEGNVDYDFAKVTVADPDVRSSGRCYLHASYWPTKNIHPGDEVSFLVRSFRFQPARGDEVWDFGDGSPAVRTQSDGAVGHRNKDGYAITQHRFQKPGDYIVTVRRSNNDGQWAVDKLDVRVLAQLSSSARCSVSRALRR